MMNVLMSTTAPQGAFMSKTVLPVALALGLATTGASARATEEQTKPPQSAEIFDVVNGFWMEKEYAKADEYIRALRVSFSNYIPVELTWVLHARRFGTQVEDCIERAKALQKTLEEQIELESPIFVEVFDTFVRKEEDLLTFYEGIGDDREQRAAERNPLDPTARVKPTRYWLRSEDYLYCLVPEAMSGEEVIWRENCPGQGNQFAGIPDEKLHRQLGVSGTSLVEKKAICRELVRRMEEEGGAERVVRELWEPSVLYTYPDLVDSLMRSPDTAIPALVAVLETSTNRHADGTRRKMAIWALVRIGRADAEVLRVLEDCRAAHPDDELGDYAARAAEYLKERAAQ